MRPSALAAIAGVATGLVALVWVQALLSQTSSYRTLISEWHTSPGVFHPMVLGTSSSVVVAIVLSAATLVAVRALRIDPAVAFRVE
jgi:hypothetical protein